MRKTTSFNTKKRKIFEIKEIYYLFKEEGNKICNKNKNIDERNSTKCELKDSSYSQSRQL